MPALITFVRPNYKEVVAHALIIFFMLITFSPQSYWRLRTCGVFVFFSVCGFSFFLFLNTSSVCTDNKQRSKFGVCYGVRENNRVDSS